MPVLAVSLSTHLAALPTDWGSVTLAQAAQLALLGEASVQDCLAVLLDCSPAELLQLNPKHLGRALQAVLFLSEPMPDREAWLRPTALHIGSIEVPVLADLSELTFGQAADIGAAIQELSQDVAALRLRVLATILQPAYDGTAYDSDRVAVLEALCGDVKLRDALPLTDFFLPSSTGSAAPTPPDSSASLSVPPSEAPTSASSRRNGTRWPSWMRWPGATKASGTTSTA
ncbi:hypothetical protein [Hymenobacter pini]|uniref:hypothetical protein n=1 Tax=Hymenobacter pini TaxID=2880879 RepID=UPI001CF44B6E|nr:hypothetical protein [Hymenobacter pini]MCA8830295.1 hypothetical protein [Hymenobacter pini]